MVILKCFACMHYAQCNIHITVPALCIVSVAAVMIMIWVQSGLQWVYLKSIGAMLSNHPQRSVGMSLSWNHHSSNQSQVSGLQTKESPCTLRNWSWRTAEICDRLTITMHTQIKSSTHTQGKYHTKISVIHYCAYLHGEKEILRFIIPLLLFFF